MGLGILSGYKIENIKNETINKLFSILLVIIFMISAIENSKIFIINNNMEKYNEIAEIEKVTKLLPYSLQLKERQLEILYEKQDNEQILKIVGQIMKIEKNYNKFILYDIVENIAINQIDNGQEQKGMENLEKAYNIFAKENTLKLDMNNYKNICQTIENTCKKLENQLKYKQIILKTINKFEENIKDNEITRKSKKEYLKIKVTLENYKENAEKYIQGNNIQ